MRLLYSSSVVLWVFLAAPATFAAGYYGSGAYADAELDLRYESNLSRSSESADIEEDMVTALSAGAGYMKPLNDKSQLLISAYLAHEHFAEFKDLNNISANTSIVYTIQPDKGYNSPFYRLSASLAWWDYNESKIRDSYFLRSGVGMTKRLGQQLLMNLDYHFQRRISEGEVFDTDRHELRAQLIYAYSPELSLFANYDLHIGEVVSTATPTPVIRAAATSIAPDDVYTAGLGPACTNRRCAYRLDAIGHFFESGVEWELNQLMSLNLSGRYFIVDGEGIDAYRGWIYRAGLYMQF